MHEIKVKTHLIVTDVQDKFDIKWSGRIMDSQPLWKNNALVWVLIGSKSRVEVNSINIAHVEKTACGMTSPKGRGAVTIDKVFIYLKEIDESEKLMGVVTHRRIKTFAPMYDSVGYHE